MQQRTLHHRSIWESHSPMINKLLVFLSDSIGLPQARFPGKLQKKTGEEG
jgi:hypothetical protein